MRHLAAAGLRAGAVRRRADVYEQMQFDDGCRDLAPGVFWMLAEHCREFKLPFDLMIGVNRRVYATASTRGRTCSTSGRR